MERKIECPAIEIHSSLTKCDCPEAAALCSRALLFPKSKNFQRPAWACPARQRCFAPGLRLPASASALGAGLASCWPRPQQLLPVSATGGGRRRCPLDKRPQLFYNKSSQRKAVSPCVSYTSPTCIWASGSASSPCWTTSGTFRAGPLPAGRPARGRRSAGRRPLRQARAARRGGAAAGLVPHRACGAGTARFLPSAATTTRQTASPSAHSCWRGAGCTSARSLPHRPRPSP